MIEVSANQIKKYCRIKKDHIANAISNIRCVEFISE
jgi:hypothetical protein